MALHTIPETIDSYTGHLTRDLAPVVTIASGDTVTCKIPDAGWGIEGFTADSNDRKTLVPDVEERELGHCLAGPIAVQGAAPGMVLEVTVNELIPSNWGWTAVGWPGALNDRLGLTTPSPRTILWDIDQESKTATADFGQTIPIHPFLGFMGIAPPMNGKFSTIEPYPGGGNIDCRELVVGSSLFLPIHVEGALFYCGDCHAAQGDCELAGTALECAVEHASLTFELHPAMPYSLALLKAPVARPIAKTPKGWVTMGLHHQLDEAMAQAADAMLALIMNLLNVDRLEAATLITTQVSFRITQAVNRVNGVHAIWPVDSVVR